jgi:integrase
MTITKTTKNGRPMWRVNVQATVGGHRKRKFFESKVAAEIWVAEARKNLRETGKLEPEQGITVADALDDYLEAKASVGKRHRKDIERFAEMLRKSFGPRLVGSVSVIELNKWINRPEWPAQATRATARRYCLCFWNWCVRNEIIERNRLLGTEVQGGTKKSIHILTVPQCAELLDKANKDMLPVIVLEIFAGLRTCEAMAATTDWIDLHDKEIIVYDSKETTGIPRRTIRIRPAFLRYWPKSFEGKVWPHSWSTWVRQRRKLRERLGWNIPQNALRHGFASYLLAAERSAGAVALEMGHSSEAMVRKVYGHAVKAKDAEAFWAL